MAKLNLYYRLGTNSKRAIARRTLRGRTYHYSPRGDLLDRLSRELGIPKNDIYLKLLEERKILLNLDT